MINMMLKDNQELIQQAVDLLKERQPNIGFNKADFHCKVWRNRYSVAVEFTRIVRYVPMGSEVTAFEYDIIVNLTSKVILPFEKSILNREFYVPTEKDLKALRFILEHLGPFSPDFENTVIEEAEAYKISCINEGSSGHYSIKKNRGK